MMILEGACGKIVLLKQLPTDLDPTSHGQILEQLDYFSGPIGLKMSFRRKMTTPFDWILLLIVIIATAEASITYKRIHPAIANSLACPCSGLCVPEYLKLSKDVPDPRGCPRILQEGG